MNAFNGILTQVLGSLHASFNLLWSKLSPVLLPLLLILIFLAVGLWLAGFIGDKLVSIIKKSKVDTLLDKILAPTLKLTGTKVHASGVITGTIKWFLTALIVIAALDMADMSNVIDFFNRVVAYLPNVFIAALIIVVGSLLANLAGTIVKFVAGNGNSSFVGTAKVAVSVLAFIAALGQLLIPIAASFNQFIGQLGISKLQTDVLVIGVIALVLLGSKNALIKTVEHFYKS